MSDVHQPPTVAQERDETRSRCILATLLSRQLRRFVLKYQETGVGDIVDLYAKVREIHAHRPELWASMATKFNLDQDIEAQIAKCQQEDEADKVNRR